MANISIEDLAKEIADELSDYSKDIVEKINISSKRISQEAVKQLKSTSPKKSRKYAKSWTVKTEKRIGQLNSHVIYNKEGWKTHLLENGHANSGGGRTEGIAHISPAEKMVIEQFTKEAEETIKNG